MPTFPLVFLLRQEGIMFEQLFPLHSHTSLTIWVSVASSRTLQHLGGCEPPPLWLMANPLYRLSGCRAYIFVYNSTFISSFVSWVSSLFQGYSTLIGQFSRVRDRIFSSLSFLFFFLSPAAVGALLGSMQISTCSCAVVAWTLCCRGTLERCGPAVLISVLW